MSLVFHTLQLYRHFIMNMSLSICRVASRTFKWDPSCSSHLTGTSLPTYEQEFNIEGPTLQMLGREDLLGGVSREHLEAALCVLDIESQDELDY